MADNVEIQGLEFQLVCNSEKAVEGVKALTNTLERLKKVLSGVDGSHTIDTIKDINTAINGVDDSKLTKLKSTLFCRSVCESQGWGHWHCPRFERYRCRNRV